MTVAMPERLRRQAQAIADLRDERDLIGRGFAVVLRKAAQSYVRRHMAEYRDLLPDELRD